MKLAVRPHAPAVLQPAKEPVVPGGCEYCLVGPRAGLDGLFLHSQIK